MSSYRDRLSRFKGQYEVLDQQLQKTSKAIDALIKLRENVEKAQAVIITVAQQTQEQLKYQIESIVSMALEAVLPEPYKFEMDFDIKRSQTEVSCWFVRDGERIRPLDAAGGGAVDIASFALRVTMWSLGKTRPTIVLDEPVKFVSRDLQSRAGLMMKELSEKLGIQFIVVSHDQSIIEGADRTFEVKLSQGRSSLTVFDE